MVSCATSLLVIEMSFFFYVFVHKLGLTYEAMRKGDLTLGYWFRDRPYGFRESRRYYCSSNNSASS